MAALPPAPTGFVTVDGGVALNPAGEPEWVDDLGNPIKYLVYADRAATQRISGLKALDGTATDVLSPLTPAQAPTTKDEGRILGFVPEAYSLVWLVREGGYPWPVPSIESIAAAADAPQAALDAQASAAAAESSASAAATSAASADATATTLQAQFDQVTTTASTVDEVGLVQVSDYAVSNVATSLDRAVVVISDPRYLAWASLVWDSWDLAASDTDYWTFSLVVTKAGVDTTIATKSTRATDGEPITAGKDWDFVGGPWTAVSLSMGDVVRLVGTKTGAPADMPRVYLLSARLTPRR